MAQVGVDFPDFFAEDRYKARHVEGLNAYDPESLITVGELRAGKTYSDKRNFPSKYYYEDVVKQKPDEWPYTPNEIAEFFPR